VDHWYQGICEIKVKETDTRIFIQVRPLIHQIQVIALLLLVEASVALIYHNHTNTIFGITYLVIIDLAAWNTNT
jgi:hypothetical protein